MQIATAEDLQAAWTAALGQYDSDARGPMACAVLRQHLDGIFDSMRRLESRLRESERVAAQQSLQEYRAKAEADYSRLSDMYGTVDAEWRRAQEEAQRQQARIKELEAQIRSMSETLAQLAAEMAASREAYDKLSATNKDLTESLSAAQQQLGAAGEALDAAKRSQAAIVSDELRAEREKSAYACACGGRAALAMPATRD